MLAAVLSLASQSITAQVNCDTVLPPPSASAYVLPFPIGETYKVIQGNCPDIGGHANTFAYDFNTQTGDTIVACRAGQVIWVNEQYADNDWTNGHENNVFIRHNDGTVIRYTHLKQNGVFVNANLLVTQGQPLGLSGSSGNTGGVPHLHLQVFRDGSSYDKWNAIPINFSNADGPVDSQNMLQNGAYYTALDGTVSSDRGPVQPAARLAVFPNPSSAPAFIEVELDEGCLARLDIMAQQGQVAERLFSGRLPAGRSCFSWRSRLAPGAYYARLQWAGRQAVAQFIIR